MLLLDINKFIEKNDLKFITTSNIMRAEKFDDNGLFSNVIFGLPNSSKWRVNYGAIALNTQIMHPLLHEIADRRASLLLKFFDGKISYDEESNTIVKNAYGSWGIPYFIANTEKVIGALLATNSLTDAGQNLCKYILKYKEYAFIDNVIVVPPQYRPVEIIRNKVEMSPLNNFYINIINDANVVRFAEGQSLKTVAWRLEYNAYMAYKELQQLIKGKEGIQRKTQLGKIMDFSARAVITGDINVEPDHFGIPIKIALVLFKPFLIYALLNTYRNGFEALGMRATQLNAGRIIDGVKDGSNLIPITVKDFIIKVLHDVVKDKVVLAKRDPALHRHSIRAVYITLVNDDTFHINPLVCGPFNADFDGDQMAIYLPLTDKAQKIAKEKMLIGSDFAGSKGDGLSIDFNKDISLGIYYLTRPYEGKPIKPVKVETPDEAEKIIFDNNDPGTPVIYNGKENTAGRAIFEMCIGVHIEEQLNKKKVVKLFESLTDKMPARVLFKNIAKLIRYGCKMASLVGKTIDITNYNLKPEFKERREKIFEKGTNIPVELEALTKDILEDFKSNPNSFVPDMLDSGAEKKINNIQSSFVAKGYVANVDGEVIPTPVKTATGEGLNPSDYYQTSISGRSGIIDRSQKTQISGYLTRQLVYGLASVKLDPKINSIKVYKPLLVNVKDDSIAKGINGRMMMNGKIITDPKSLIGKTIGIVSPLFWTTRELGAQCLPDYVYKNLKSTNIGIIAAQAIGERSSQLIMQTFHMTSSKGFENFLANDADLEKLCSQDKDGNITSKVPIMIKVFREDITDMTSDEYIFKDFSIESENLKIELSLDYDFTLVINDSDDVINEKGVIIARYGDGTIFGSMKNSANTIAGAVAQIVKLVNTRIVTNPEKLVTMLYGLLDGVPMWACEILVSQLFRDPEKTSLPYRCGKRNDTPERVGLKSISVLENWRRGAAFENVSKAFHTAVLTDNDKSDVSTDLDSIVAM